MDDLTTFKKEGFEHQKLYRLSRRAENRMDYLPFINGLVVTDLGYYPCAEGHLVQRPDGVNGHILVFCFGGKGWFELQGKRRDVGAMEVFWIPAGQAHAYGSARQEGWEIFWIHARGARVDELLKWTSMSSQRPLATFAHGNAVRRQFNMMLQALELGFSDHVLFQLARFLVTVVGLLHVDVGPAGAVQQRERLERAVEAMRESVAAPLALAEYAEASGLAVSRFSSLFKQQYGSSPMAYLAELRIQRACELLDTTEMNVQQIAYELGFDDPLYFSRMFKKVAGLAPSLYRLEHR